MESWATLPLGSREIPTLLGGLTLDPGLVAGPAPEIKLFLRFVLELCRCGAGLVLLDPAP